MKPIRVLAHRTVDLHHRTVVNLSPGSRRCWFCREADPRAFKKVAHLVPQALGNKHLVTAEECDSCNTDYFANEIDDSFLKALQPYRLLHAARGQRGRLTLPKSSKSESRVKLAVPERRVVELTDSDADPMIEELDFESGEIVVAMDVPSHDPLAVPKALARMGMLVSTELRDSSYDWLRRWVLGDRAEGGRVRLLPVHHFRAHTTEPTPHLTLQVMEFPSDGLPPNCARHFVFLWFAQCAFLFPIPPSPDGQQVAFPLVGRMPGINASFNWQHFKRDVEGRVPATPARIPIAFEGYEVKVLNHVDAGDA